MSRLDEVWLHLGPHKHLLLLVDDIAIQDWASCASSLVKSGTWSGALLIGVLGALHPLLSLAFWMAEVVIKRLELLSLVSS